MNSVLEQKLRELMDEARRQGSPAIQVITHMMLACCANGTQNDLAKWVCQYSPGLKVETEVAGGREALPGEFSSEPETPWIC